MPTSSLYHASMPASQVPTPTQTPESPAPRSYLIAGDQTWPCIFSDVPKATNVVSDVRPVLTVAIVYSGDADLQLLRNYLRGGTVCLVLPSGQAVTMGTAKLDSFKNLDTEFPQYVTVVEGRRIGVLKLSCDSRFYRST